MIVTVTANPSLDRTVALGEPLAVGEVQRASSGREDAGGKGVNVARAIHGAGLPVRAVLPLAADDPFGALVAATGVVVATVPVAGRVRANITLVDPSGETTKINLPGARVSVAEREALVAGIVAASTEADWLVLAGSLPPGAGDDFYVDAVNAVRADSPRTRIAVDTSGAALRAVVAHARVDLIKPNEDELAELLGEVADETTETDLVAAAVRRARSLLPRVGSVLVTLGSRGALLVTADTVLRAHAPRIRVASTVGAGDSSLAGYLIAHTTGASAADALARAVAYGAAAASLPGTRIPVPDDLPAGVLTVETLESRRTA